MKGEALHFSPKPSGEKSPHCSGGFHSRTSISRSSVQPADRQTWFTFVYVQMGLINSSCSIHIESALFLLSSSIIVSLCITLWKLWPQLLAYGTTRHQSCCSQSSWNMCIICPPWQSALVHWTCTWTLYLSLHMLTRHDGWVLCSKWIFSWENSIPSHFSYWLTNTNITGLALFS